MANLAFAGSHSVNGVAALHTDLMKKTVFADIKLQFSFDYTYEEALQQVLNRLAQLPALPNNVQPTIKIPVGYKFNVRINRDILFEAPYAPMRAAQ